MEGEEERVEISKNTSGQIRRVKHELRTVVHHCKGMRFETEKKKRARETSSFIGEAVWGGNMPRPPQKKVGSYL